VRASTENELEELLPVSIKLWSEPQYVVGFDFVAEGILKVAADQKGRPDHHGGKPTALREGFGPRSQGGVL
jgi:hypothetical protein